MLTPEKRQEIIAALTANAGMKAAAAWQGVDLAAAADADLEAFDRFRRMQAPVENGSLCPCGRKHVWNEGRAAWEHQGAPVENARPPATLEEFFQRGGGTQADRETWQMAQNAARQRRTEVLAQLTANMDETRRGQFWAKHEQTPIQDLEEMLELLPRQQPQPERPTANYYGAQGAPAAAPAIELVLEPMTIDFGRKTA